MILSFDSYKFCKSFAKVSIFAKIKKFERSRRFLSYKKPTRGRGGGPPIINLNRNRIKLGL